MCRRAQCRAGRRGARGDPGGVEPHLRAAGGRRGELDPGTSSRAGHGRGIRTRARQTRESCCRTGMLGSLAPGARPCRPSAARTWGVMRPADDMRPGGGGRGSRARTPSGASSRTVWGQDPKHGARACKESVSRHVASHPHPSRAYMRLFDMQTEAQTCLRRRAPAHGAKMQRAQGARARQHGSSSPGRTRSMQGWQAVSGGGVKCLLQIKVLGRPQTN